MERSNDDPRSFSSDGIKWSNDNFNSREMKVGDNFRAKGLKGIQSCVHIESDFDETYYYWNHHESGGNFVMSKDVLEVYPKEMTIKELLRLFHKTIRVEESGVVTSGVNLSKEEIYENQTFVTQRLKDFSKTDLIDYILNNGTTRKETLM